MTDDVLWYYLWAFFPGFFHRAGHPINLVMAYIFGLKVHFAFLGLLIYTWVFLRFIWQIWWEVVYLLDFMKRIANSFGTWLYLLKILIFFDVLRQIIQQANILVRLVLYLAVFVDDFFLWEGIVQKLNWLALFSFNINKVFLTI